VLPFAVRELPGATCGRTGSAWYTSIRREHAHTIGLSQSRPVFRRLTSISGPAKQTQNFFRFNSAIEIHDTTLAEPNLKAMR
jgi:hypothetical protein